MTIKELRELTGLSQTDFGKYYNIPVHTIKKWESPMDSVNYRKCPVYVNELLERAIKEDFGTGNKTVYSSSNSNLIDNVVATLAIEEMYLSPEFVSELKKVSEGKRSSEDLRQEVIRKYAGH